MSTPLKQHKDLEWKLHERLYNNLLFLTYNYPTTKDFDFVFKRDMFMKNNKAAFHHVVYYLLNILNPRLIKEKISTWPLHEVKLESKFRNEVLAYINELNLFYEDADIPSIMASHLISPGGFKFVKFMCKLSQLVIREHLMKNAEIEAEMLYPVKPHGNSAIINIALKNLKKKIVINEAETKENFENFLELYENAIDESNNIDFEQSQLNRDLDDLVKLDVLKKSCNNEIKQETLVKKIEDIRNKNVKLDEIKKLCVKCNDLLICLLSNDSALEYDKNNLLLPTSVTELHNTDNGKLDLTDLFTDMVLKLEKENLKMPILTADEVNNVTKILGELFEKYLKLKENQTLNTNKLSEALHMIHHISELRQHKTEATVVETNGFSV